MNRRELRQETLRMREELRTAIRIDIEADSADVESVSRIHCIWTYDPVHESWQSYRSADEFHPIKGRSYVAHNGDGYDYPLLARFGVYLEGLDTLRLARLYKPAIQEVQGERHSLRAWGIRLKCHKGDFEGPWDKWTQEMDDYCRQDVEVLHQLAAYLSDQEELWRGFAVAGRRRHHEWCDLQMDGGVRIDVPYLTELYEDLAGDCVDLEMQLQRIVPPKVEHGKRPGYYQSPDGTKYLFKKDAPKPLQKSLTPGPPKETVIQFNPRSSQWVVDHLTSVRGWIPTVFTPKTEKGGGGNPSVAAKVLEGLTNRGWPEVELLLEYALADKIRSGLRSNEDGGLLNKVSDSELVRGTIIPSGANTHRCAHRDPNLANVPVRTELGQRVRQGFIARQGRTLIGFDAKGLEMGGLGHYLTPYDGGEWSRMFAAAETAEKYTEGDPHWRTVIAAGSLDRVEHWQAIAGEGNDWRKAARDAGKTKFYALLYGAGDVRLGEAYNPSVPELIEAAKRNPQKVKALEKTFVKREGRRPPEHYGALGVVGGVLRDKLRKGINGLDGLLSSIDESMKKRGHLVAIDGRPLWGRSPHSWLNLLIQSWGAVVMEYAVVFAHQDYEQAGMMHGRDFNLILQVHDEWQDDVVDDCLDEVERLGLAAFPKAAELLQVNTSVIGDAARGNTWRETH
jgi:hypothetical protein